MPLGAQFITFFVIQTITLITNLPFVSTIRRCLVLFVLMMSPVITLAAKPLTYNVTGLSDSLHDNVSLYLGSLPVIDAGQFAQYQLEITLAVEESLKALGYYQPVITFQHSKKRPTDLTINVNPGKPVRIRELQISLEGAAQADPAFQQLLQQSPVKVGKVLNDGDYEALKTRLNDLALTRGYFDAQLVTHQVTVYPEQHAADIVLIMNSGRRFAFGPVNYDSSVTLPTQRLLATMINFTQGEPYSSQKVSQLSVDFSATGYFRSIDVRPLRDQAQGNEVPMLISVVPKTHWAIDAGIGYSTDEGPRLTLGIVNHWLGEKGHSFKSDIKLSGAVNELTGRYKVPYGNPLLEYYSLDGGYQGVSNLDTDSHLISASVNRWKKRPGNWNQNFFLRLDFENFTQGGQSDSSTLLVPGVAFDRRTINGSPTNPKSGSFYSVKLEASAKALLANANFVRLWGHAKWLSSFWDRHRLIGRVDQGGLWVDDIASVPPSVRFFTGGDQTVRGYDFDSISPRNSRDQLVGGRYLSVGSIEYTYEFYPNWQIAVFVDSGTVTDDYRNNTVGWKTGVGPGLRWITPLGPLKLDFAFAISEPDSPVRIHFSIGPDI